MLPLKELEKCAICSLFISACCPQTSSKMAWESFASDFTLTVTSPSLSVQVKGITCYSSCQDRSWKTLNSLALKQCQWFYVHYQTFETGVDVDLDLDEHSVTTLANPRTFASSFLLSPHFFITPFLPLCSHFSSFVVPRFWGHPHWQGWDSFW